MSILTDDLAERPLAVASVICALTIFIYNAFRAKQGLPTGVPWAGQDSKQWFGALRLRYTSLFHSLRLLHEGYTKYNKLGRAYIFPGTLTADPALILPKSQWSWFLEQSDDDLSPAAFHYDCLGHDYAFTEKMILREPYHEHVIHKYLPRKMPALIPDLQEEVAVGFDDAWGMDTEEWRDVKLYDSVMLMISRAVNRMIVGLPLCRNEDYLNNSRRFSMAVVPPSTLLNFFPKWLQPIAGRILFMPSWFFYWKMRKYTKPLIEQRKAEFEKVKSDPELTSKLPNDFITWTLLLTEADNRPDEATVNRISKRVLPIEFASIHTSAISITQCLFDLISSDPSLGYLNSIRSESEEILNSNHGQWTKPGLAECFLADSALRESMRISNFISVNSTKKVLAEKGITHPTEGWHAPKGTYIAFDLHNAMHDPDVYLNAASYEAFRFAQNKKHETASSKPHSESPNGTATKTASTGNTNLATTSETWFPFSRGAHTCPGRFLIAAEIKMLLAYMTINYEIEPLATRPADLKVGRIILPNPDATVRVRRRKTAA